MRGVRRAAGVVLAVLVLASGCGRGGTSSTATTAGGSATTARAATGPGDFGSLTSVCGPGAAAGATDKGVSAAGIDIGTMADPGATVSPGLDVELFDTAKAFVAWCNAAGGILGRHINLHLRDAALFNVPARTLEACAQDFAEVGSGTAFDDSGVAPRVACGLPSIPAYDNTPKAADAPLQAGVMPSKYGIVAQFRGFQTRFPGELKAGFLTTNLASVVVTKDRFKESAQDIGFQAVYDASYPVTGLANAESYVQQMKSAGVQMLMELGDVNALVALEKAMQTVGWYPDAIVEPANAYDQLLVRNAGAALKNTWVEENYVPFEDAARNPATQQYLDLMKQYNPTGKIAALGLNSWNAWLLFATAARDCGSGLTRACLLSKAQSHADWTGGGLQGPAGTDPATSVLTDCFAIVQATPAGFSPDASFLAPNQGSLNCDPRNIVTLKGTYGG